MRARELAGFLGLFLLGCLGGGIGDDLPMDRSPPLDDAGRPISDGPVASEPCPESPPKVGEACPPTFLDSDSCEFQVGECVGTNGSLYPEFVSYCCIGKQWRICGGRSACDLTASPDATPALSPDASSDATNDV